MLGVTDQRRNIEVDVSLTLVTEVCNNCRIVFAMPADLMSECAGNPERHFYCPNGHSLHYPGQTAEQREREQRERAERAEQRLNSALTRERATRDQLQASERSRAAIKGHLTRTRKAIANGVCPVSDCRRNFINIRAHINHQHPEWAAEHAEAMS